MADAVAKLRILARGTSIEEIGESFDDVNSGCDVDSRSCVAKKGGIQASTQLKHSMSAKSNKHFSRGRSMVYINIFMVNKL